MIYIYVYIYIYVFSLFQRFVNGFIMVGLFLAAQVFTPTSLLEHNVPCKL